MAPAAILRKLIDGNRASLVVRFVLVGGTNFVLTNAIYVSILYFFDNYHAAYWISLVAGTTFVSYGNSLFVFKKKIKYYFMLPYFAYYIVYSLTFYNILVYTIESGLLPKYFALAIIALCIFPIHYVCSRVIIHRLGSLRSHSR